MNTCPDVVVLKLSGAAMAGPRLPWSGEAFEAVADQIAEIVAAGTRCGVVIGGGNFIRAGMPWGRQGMDTSAIDQLGILGSGWNASALAFQLARGDRVKPRIISRAAGTAGYAERWDPDVLADSVDEVLIVAGGLGQEGVSTDVAAPLLAADMGADRIVMAKHGVDGLYDTDPHSANSAGRQATFLPELTMAEALRRDLKIMDRAAMELCQEHGVTVHIVGASDPAEPLAIARAALGAPIGSLLLPN